MRISVITRISGVPIETRMGHLPNTDQKIRIVGEGVQLGPLGTAATDWPIVAFPG
jgi:hypothetical protein